MTRHLRQTILVLVLLLAAVPIAQSQLNSPRIGYVYPAGGRRGTSFQVAVGGQFLNSITNAFISGHGVRAAVLEFNRPMTQKEFNDLRDKLKELQDKRAIAFGEIRTNNASTNRVVWTAEDRKMIAEIRAKMQKNPPNRSGNPAIAETVTLQMTLAAGAEPGDRELRLGTQNGLSNPLMFRVGQLPEFSQPAASGRNREQRVNNEPTSSLAEPEMNITLPAVVNGQIMPGCMDRFRFQATKGQQLVVAVSARELIPYLPDAVPGWFQAAVAICDTNGNELAYADHFEFHPDPVLHFEIPNDGSYVIKIRDSIYRGREDFVYRVTAGELPFVTDIFPLGGHVGDKISFALNGWNLPPTNRTSSVNVQQPGVYLLPLTQFEESINRVIFTVDTLPECLEQEPNNLPESAQLLTLPVIVNGRIDKPGDWDVFRFAGHAGDKIVAEVLARRLNSPLDSVLKLTDATGAQLAFNDDHEDKATGLNTHHADSYLTATLPADGNYYLYLGDAQRNGGSAYAYRLRISAPRPDFELRVVPSSVNVRAGASAPITVYALRKDGFTNEIALALPDTLPGFKLSGGKIPANQDQIRLTLTPPPTSFNGPINLSLEGSALIQGRTVLHTAVPAEDMMQAFLYRHLVPVRELKVSVFGRFMPRAVVRIISATPVKIPIGGTARVRVATPSSAFLERFRLELGESPEGITIKSVSPVGEGVEIVLQSEAAKARPGLKGNLIINEFVKNAGPLVNGKPQGNRQQPAGSLPAIPFEIVAE